MQTRELLKMSGRLECSYKAIKPPTARALDGKTRALQKYFRLISKYKSSRGAELQGGSFNVEKLSTVCSVEYLKIPFPPLC
jgi:hypothetical protein